MYEGPRGAIFDDARTYRYALWRTWDAEAPTVAFVMLNPSTADATTLDPTCRRCRGFAESWGYGSVLVGNLFALRSTDPGRLRDHDDPVGPANDRHLRRIAGAARTVVAAWGVHGAYRGRDREVAARLDADLMALDTTRDGHPGHPLYLPGDLEPTPWAPAPRPRDRDDPDGSTDRG